MSLCFPATRWVDPWGLRHAVVIDDDVGASIMIRNYQTGCGIVLTVDDVTKNRMSKGCTTCLWCATRW